jgi:hypothetical protein
MDLDDRTRKVLEGITDLRQRLSKIWSNAVEDSDFNTAGERLRRWKERAVRFLKDNVSEKEAINLHSTELRVFTAGDPLGNLSDEIGLYDSVLKTLVEEIQDDPDILSAAFSSAKSASLEHSSLKGEQPPAAHSQRANHTAIKQEQSIDIFISHSSADARTAEALIDLLRAALNIPADRIRCTSVDGYRLPIGASTEEWLRQEVSEAKVFIGLITPTSLQSAYVLFELGARWGAHLHLAPVLASGANPNLLHGPLASLNALRCDVPAQVHQLITDIAKILGRDQNNPSSYQKYLELLVQQSQPANQ